MLRKKTNPAHPDYGISVGKKSGKHYYSIRLPYRGNNGKVTYLERCVSMEGRKGEPKRKVLERARKLRDEMLEVPEIKAFIEETYAAPYRAGVFARKRHGDSAKHTIPGLTGLSLSIVPPREPGRSGAIVLVAQVKPHVSAARKKRTWSLMRHDPAYAVREAVRWRAGILECEEPGEAEISSGIRAVWKFLRDYSGIREVSDSAA